MSRKFRWTLEADFPSSKLEPHLVKVNSRPNIEIEEVNYLEEKQLKTKEEWQSITTTFFDVNSNDEKFTSLWKILGTVYDFTADGKMNEKTPEELAKMAGTLKLQLVCPVYEYPPTEKTVENNKHDTDNPMGIGTLGFNPMNRKCVGWEPLEEWTLKNAWPTNINFGELDYSSSDTCEIEVTWRYKEVFYKQLSKPWTMV